MIVVSINIFSQHLSCWEFIDDNKDIKDMLINSSFTIWSFRFRLKANHEWIRKKREHEESYDFM